MTPKESLALFWTSLIRRVLIAIGTFVVDLVVSYVQSRDFRSSLVAAVAG